MSEYRPKSPSNTDGGGDPSAQSEERPISDALAQHHLGLEEAFTAIVARARKGETSATFRVAWDVFERELLQHMAIEEKDLFPPIERSHGEEVRALQIEHDVIRERLFEIGLALDRHQLRAPAIEEFAARLRTHALREDLVLYPWTERHRSHDAWHTLGLGRSDSDVLARIASSRS